MVNLPVEDVHQRYVQFEIAKYDALLEIGPSTLVDLERLAQLAAFSDPNPNNIQEHINSMRHVYNLEFKLRCDECGTAHDQDEITAPER